VARLIADGKWWQLAACRSADPDLFFPISPTGRSLEQAADARAICALPGPAPVSRVRAADQAGPRHLGRPHRGGAPPGGQDQPGNV